MDCSFNDISQTLGKSKSRMDLKISDIKRSCLNSDDFYFVCNGKKISSIEEVADDSPVHVSLKVRGGKGGFGSMLRAIGAQIEKTTNREACRDLSGRRIRDINEERRLKNWIAHKEQREKEANERRKKRLQRLCQDPSSDFNDEEYEKERYLLTENMNESLQQGLKSGPIEYGLKKEINIIMKNAEDNNLLKKKHESLDPEFKNIAGSSGSGSNLNTNDKLPKPEMDTPESICGTSELFVADSRMNSSESSLKSQSLLKRHSDLKDIIPKKRVKGGMLLEFDIDEISSCESTDDE